MGKQRGGLLCLFELVSATTGSLSGTWISPWQSHASCSQSHIDRGWFLQGRLAGEAFREGDGAMPKQRSPAFATALLWRKFSTTQVPDLA